MAVRSAGAWLLDQEARALLTRLRRVRPFVLYETMVPAAAPSPVATSAIHKYLAGTARRLQLMVIAFLQWLEDADSRGVPPELMQRRFTLIRLRFNSMISQFDIFADVITQRSEYETGVWLGGLDSVAGDALRMPGGFYDAPPIVCYLDRGHGAAIRRARTRLPGGGDNPVAVIRVPRERMVGAGIASSLFHEVGHQGAALLDLITSLRTVLHNRQNSAGEDRVVWELWERWISEIVADFWSIARVGISSTMGLIGVVSLPRAFVFRLNLDDPHPAPWIRVMLSATIGEALYPHPQWARLRAIWESYYPLTRLKGEARDLFERLVQGMPAFVGLLANHRPKSLRGNSLREAMQLGERSPALLQRLWTEWGGNPSKMRSTPPSIVFAAIGQARADGKVAPEQESRLLGELLAYWAMRDALDVSSACAEAGVPLARGFAFGRARQLRISA
jgi:hypothetical protein